MVFAGVVEHARIDVFSGGEAYLVPPQRLSRQDVEANTLDPTRGAVEATLDNLVPNPDRLENLGSFIALECGDSHFRHDLEHSLGDAFSIPLNNLVVGVAVGKESVAAAFAESLKGEVGIDRIRSVSNQQAMVVNLSALGGFEDDSNPGSLGLLDKVLVDGAAGEERACRDAARADGPVGKDDQAVAIIDGLFGFTGNSFEGVREPILSIAARVGDVDGLCLPSAVVHFFQRRQFSIGEYGMRYPEPGGLFL